MSYPKDAIPEYYLPATDAPNEDASCFWASTIPTVQNSIRIGWTKLGPSHIIQTMPLRIGCLNAMNRGNSVREEPCIEVIKRSSKSNYELLLLQAKTCSSACALFVVMANLHTHEWVPDKKIMNHHWKVKYTFKGHPRDTKQGIICSTVF